MEKENAIEESRIVKRCFRVFEHLMITAYKNGAEGPIGFFCGSEEEVFKEGFSIFYEHGFSQKVRIIGAPCGIDEMSNYAIVDINAGTGRPPKIALMIFPD